MESESLYAPTVEDSPRSDNLNETQESTCSSNSQSTSSGNASNEKDGSFECNICFDEASEAVISYCGHIFCWSCLQPWLDLKPAGQQTCPVCKSVISEDKVIPVYGRNSKDKIDPRKKLPSRPRGQWEQSRSTGQDTFYPDFGPFPNAFNYTPGGFHMTFGFGAFPFGLFTTAVMGNANTSVNEYPIDSGLLKNIFLFLGIFLIAWIVMG